MNGTIRIDLHVHTARYSQCAEAVRPLELAMWALRAGLHAVVLTDHDVLWEGEEVAALQSAFPEVRFFRGIECTVRGAHVLVYGIDEAAHLQRGMPVERAVDVVRAAGGAAVLAHPYRDGDPHGLPLAFFDAFEVASTSFRKEDVARSLALSWEIGKPAVAGSDAHALARVGWAFTELPRMPADDRELAAMLKAGLGNPVVAGAWPSQPRT